MKYLTSCLLFLSLFLSAGLAQEFSKEFGAVSLDELNMEYFEKDKSAEALVLHDIGSIEFLRDDEGFYTLFSQRKRIKIFKEAGLDYAEIELPFYYHGSLYEKVYAIEALTFNLVNGQIVVKELNENDVYEEVINEYWRRKKFVFPDVQEGSVIEFRYRLMSRDLHNLKDWVFQDRIPVLFSEYTATLTPFFNYAYILQGARGFDFKNSAVKDGFPKKIGGTEYREMIHTYRMLNVPAFKDEEFLTSVDDYIIKLDFQLSSMTTITGVETSYMSTWEEMCEDYLDRSDFGKYMKRSQKLSASIIASIDRKDKTDLKIARDIVEYIKLNYNWNGYYGKIATQTPKEFMKNKTGSIADINLFLVGALREAGFTVQPVFLSTRDHGKIPYDYPFSHFFNYVIAAMELENGYYILDASAPNLSNARIPPRCLNGNGLVVDKDNPTWVDLNYKEISELHHDIQMKVDEDLEAIVTLAADKYRAYYYRNRYGDDLDELKEDMGTKLSNYSLSEVKILNAWENDKTYIMTLQMNGSLEKIGQKYYINPFQGFVPEDNPLKQNSRQHPIDMVYPEKKSFTVHLDIPPAYEVESLPGRLNIKRDGIEISYEATRLENNKVKIEFAYAFLRSVYPASDYQKIKLYYNEIISKSSEHIVLREVTTKP